MVEKYRVQISGDLGSNFKFVFVEGDNKYSTVNSVTKKKKTTTTNIANCKGVKGIKKIEEKKENNK